MYLINIKKNYEREYWDMYSYRSIKIIKNYSIDGFGINFAFKYKYKIIEGVVYMKKKGIALVITGVVVVGALTGFAFAQSDKSKEKSISDIKVEQNFVKRDTKSLEKDMIQIMRKNGYKDMAKAMETDDYEVMDDFMNNMTDKDYDNMIKIMKESGYGNMATMMESIDREEMIEMHNSMGGAENCHGASSNESGMMNSF